MNVAEIQGKYGPLTWHGGSRVVGLAAPQVTVAAGQRVVILFGELIPAPIRLGHLIIISTVVPGFTVDLVHVAGKDVLFGPFVDAIFGAPTVDSRWSPWFGHVLVPRDPLNVTVTNITAGPLEVHVGWSCLPVLPVPGAQHE